MNYTYNNNIKLSLIDTLIDKGYPKEKISVDLQLDKLTAIDVAIFDTKFNIPTMIFVIMQDIEDKEEKYNGKQKVNSIIETYGKTITSFIVYPGDDKTDFEVYEVENYENTIINNKIPEFDSNYYEGKKNSLEYHYNKKLEQNSIKWIHIYSIFNWICAFTIFIISINFFDKRLILVGFMLNVIAFFIATPPFIIQWIFAYRRRKNLNQR